MGKFHVRVIGGWCGNRIVMVADMVTDLFAEHGFDCRVTHQSIWETYLLPPNVDLILQLMPAFTEAEAGCPILNVRPLIRDLYDPETIESILTLMRHHFEPTNSSVDHLNGLNVPAAKAHP